MIQIKTVALNESNEFILKRNLIGVTVHPVFAVDKAEEFFPDPTQEHPLTSLDIIKGFVVCCRDALQRTFKSNHYGNHLPRYDNKTNREGC